MTSQKTLYILRHAKAENGHASQDDHARTLSARGVEGAAVMGNFLVKHGVKPEKVLCSTAIRTAETLIKLEECYRHPLPVEYREKLYLASASDMLAMIADTPEEIRRLMVIGHNPGIHQLCLKLAKEGDEDLLDTLSLKFPTCAFAAIEFDHATWADLKIASGRLTDFVTPKMLGQKIVE
jgi:phosphohistidine phosphatase